MKKRLTAVLSAMLLVNALSLPAQAGVIGNPNTGGTPGSWTVGAAPTKVDPNKPAILFVHGLNSNAEVWYKDNDMFQIARDNGYETAFINLHDITGTSQSMWDNGKLLADKIKEISAKFGGKKLVIVAHSKGGVDTQAALVHNNAYSYVSNVITLSSPHYGSQLADLAYSSEASWLADLLGAKNPGTASVQTSYMQYFRSQTDNHANVGKNKFYTLSGNDYGSGSASHFLGGLYLSSFGPNDGVVTVANAVVPKGTVVKVGPWNHSTVRTGSYTFNLFKQYLTLKTAALDAKSPLLAAADTSRKAKADAQSQHIVRGGAYNGSATETFPVENGVASLTLDWVSNNQNDRLEITAPNGKKQSVDVKTVADDELFRGAWHHTAVISNPQAGKWTVHSESGKAGAYLFTAAFEQNAQHKAKIAPNAIGAKKLQVESEGLKTEKTRVKYSVDFYQTKGAKPEKINSKKLKVNELAAPNGEIPVPATEGEGFYNITTEVQGETAQGYPFERTLIRSVYVDENGKTYDGE